MAKNTIDTTDASERLIESQRLGRTNERHDQTKAAEARKTHSDARGLSKAEMIARFRTEMFHNVLPQPPEIPGYHCCWLSTTNQYDPIAHREAMGYERVTPEEMPGMQHITIDSGQFAGCIGHKEMVLFKLPIDLYQEYMKIAHHERPYEQEERVRETARYIQETAREGGAAVYLGDGTSEFINARQRREPTFE
jgi:hypothetical protein